RSRTTRTLSAALCSRVSAANVPSEEPSSTKIASHAVPSGSSAERSSSYSRATLRSSLCTGTTTEITAARLPRRYAGREMAELLSLAEAQARVLERASPLESEPVPIADAGGRVVAEAARALVDLPPFPSSAMDGFAVRASDTPGRLPVVPRIAAGAPADSALASAGADIETLPAVADNEEAHRAALDRGLAADVLVTSGGVSVGPHDLVRGLLRELGAEEVFWGVAVKPGKPVAFGVRGGTLVFGLPGNPVSSLVGCELFVRPAVLGLQGVPDPRPPFRPGRLARAVRRTGNRDELLRARTRGED